MNMLAVLLNCKIVRRPKDLPGWMTVTAAGLGGLAYWVTIYPLDQIKSAMSTDAIIVSQRKYPNMMVTAQVGLASALCTAPFRGESAEDSASYLPMMNVLVAAVIDI